MCVCRQPHGLLYPLSIGDEVNFRLTYDGPLKSASQSDTRRKEKHLIRIAFSRQLEQLFKVRDVLHRELHENAPSAVFKMAKLYKRGDIHCFPLVRGDLHLVCDLDILFLRREEPGALVDGGDLDNRIKVLFDALRVPMDDNEVRGLSIPESDVFLLCLAEDDKLITGFRVTTDRLLEPPTSEAQQNDVRLVINVEVKATKLTPENMGYFSHF